MVPKNKFPLSISAKRSKATALKSLVEFFYFPLFWGMKMYDNEFETKENKDLTKDKIEPQPIQL